MSVCLVLVGAGFLSHGTPTGTLPIILAIFILFQRFFFRPSLAERLVRFLQSGGVNQVPRVALFTEEGLRVTSVNRDPSKDDGVSQFPWEKLDRVESAEGYLFFLPFKASPRGLVVPEDAIEAKDLAVLKEFLSQKELLKVESKLSEDSLSEAKA